MTLAGTERRLAIEEEQVASELLDRVIRSWEQGQSAMNLCERYNGPKSLLYLAPFRPDDPLVYLVEQIKKPLLG